MAKKLVWPRRGECVNILLAYGVSYGDLDWKNVVLDGIAGEQFDKTLKGAEASSVQCNDYINVAIALSVPVEGLEADGEFGPVWDKVVALCKAGDVEVGDEAPAS